MFHDPRFVRGQSLILQRIRVRVRNAKAHKWLVGAAVLVLVLGGFWHFMNVDAPASSRGQDVAPVRIATVERRDMPIVEHTLGTMVANSMVNVTARVQGTLESADFQEGQFVKKGDLLYEVDPRPFHAALAQASGALLRDEALLQNANSDKQRSQTLFEKNTISSQQRDTAATNADALAATVAVDKAALDIAQLNLDYTKIRSPIDGKTGPILIQAGNMVDGTSNMVLVTIAELQPIKLSFNLPESDYPSIRARQKSQALIATIDSRALSAPVDFTSNVVSNTGGTIELRANFDNADLSLLPGQMVDVTVELNNIPNALVVPHNALNDGPDGPYVYLVADGRAEPRNIKILFDDSVDAAIEGDLKPGDDVVVEGQLRVVPDGPVKVFPPAGVSNDGGIKSRKDGDVSFRGRKDARQ